MLERLREFSTENGLIGPGDRVLAGFSGGADSTCLLHLLHRAGVDVVAAHLDHGQRPEAKADIDVCAAFAEKLGVPFVSGTADVPAMSKDLKIGIEEAGRRARYAFFDEAAAETGCRLIATAHTLSDHVETVLLNVARGTGLAGLAGIPLRRGNIVRPLRFASRDETVAYCKEQKLEFLHDSGNDNLQFARVRIRKNILPELMHINANIQETVLRLSLIADEEDRFLDGAAAAALEHGEIRLNGPLRFLTIDAEAAFRRDYLLHLPPVLLKRALRLVAQALGGTLDHHLTEQLTTQLAEQPKGSLTSEGGLVVLSWDEESLHVQKAAEEPAFKSPLPVPGDTFCDEHGWKFAISIEDAKPGVPLRGDLSVPLDPDAFRGPLHFRQAANGDEMRPIGGVGHRKLSDLMSEAGLTLLARRRLPILCDIIGPLWAPGVSLDERARLSPGSKKALRMVFGAILDEGRFAETESSPQTYANR